MMLRPITNVSEVWLIAVLCAGSRQLHAQVLEQASQLQVAHAAATGAAASASLAAARCPRCQAADAAAEQLRLELAAGAASTAPAPLADTEPRLAKLTAAHAAAHEELQQIRTSLACEMAVAADLARHNGALKHANESLTTELAQLTEQLTRERSNGTAAKATAGQADTGKALAVGSQPASWDQLKLQVAQEVRLPSPAPLRMNLSTSAYSACSTRQLIIAAGVQMPLVERPQALMAAGLLHALIGHATVIKLGR